MKWYTKSILINLAMWAAFILFCLIVTSCNPQKKLNKLIDKHPELVQNDTITIRDTIILPGSSIDTIVQNYTIGDTIFLEKDRLKIKTVYYKDSIFIEGECETDTIFYTKEIPVEKVVYLQDTIWSDVKKFVRNSWKLLLSALFLFISYRILKKFSIL